jgi:hypothetical protein
VVAGGCTKDEPEAVVPVQPLVPSGFDVVESTEDAPGTGGSAYTVTMEAAGSRDDLADELDAAARAQGFEQQARDDADDRTVMAYRKAGDVTLTYTLTPDGEGRWTAVAILLEP